jgi:hypothetical protein
MLLPDLSGDEVIRRLRALGQPATLFGEVRERNSSDSDDVRRPWSARMRSMTDVPTDVPGFGERSRRVRLTAQVIS